MNYKKLTIVLLLIEIILITILYYYVLYLCWDSKEMTYDYCTKVIIHDNIIAFYIYTILMYTGRIVWIWILVSIYKLMRNKYSKH